MTKIGEQRAHRRVSLRRVRCVSGMERAGGGATRQRIVCHQSQACAATRRIVTRVANSSSRSPTTNSRHSADSRLVNSQIASRGGSVPLFTSAPAAWRPSAIAVKARYAWRKRRDARRPQRIELPPAAATLRSGIADPGLEQALALEPIEGGVDGVDRHIAPRAGVNLLPDGGSIRRVLEAQDAHQDELFEIAEHGCVRVKPHCGGYYHARAWMEASALALSVCAPFVRRGRPLAFCVLRLKPQQVARLARERPADRIER